MSFFEGILTGAATSIDTQLKKDMERTQERAEGMAQYRVTRRRAEIERQDKEKREVSDVLNKLASLVDGDVDKAAQLYVSGGKSVSGGTALYDELKKNADAGKDIFTIDTFAKARAKPGQLTDYVSRFVTPISPLPSMEGEMKGAGLYGAVFKPDLTESVMKQVEEEAPLPASEKFLEGAGPTAAKIDRTGFLVAEEYKRKKKKEGQEDTKFDMDVSAFEQNKVKQDALITQIANDEARANRGELTEKEKITYQRNRDKLLDVERKVKLEQEAEMFVLDKQAKKLGISTDQLALDKAKKAPEFNDYEEMAVYYSNKLGERGLTNQQTNDYEQLRDDALAGAAAFNADTNTDSIFSDQNRDSLINAEVKRQLERVGMIDDLGLVIQEEIDGNKPKYFDRMTRALDNLRASTFELNDNVMNKMLAGQRATLTADKNAYKKENADSAKNAGSYQVFKSSAFKDTLTAGDVVTYETDDGDIATRIWTGERYI